MPKSPHLKSVSPWSYIITLYLPFGIMMGLLTTIPGNMFKLLGYSNEVVGMIGGVGIIAAFRFLYAPWLDGAASKRVLSFFTVGTAGLCLALVALVVFFRLEGSTFIWVTVGALIFLAIVNAAHETTSDGFYIRALDAGQQAKFIGIKTAAIRIGNLSVVMGLLLLATKIAASYGATGVDSPDKSGFYIGFSTAYAISAAAMFLFLAWNLLKLPRLTNDQAVKHDKFAVWEVILEYFQQRRVFWIIAFIFFYRFGEGFLLLKGPFYLDPVYDGGLATAATAIPYYSILTDIPWAIAGGIMGGFLIKWFGLRKMLIPLVLCMSLPNFAYVAMAWFQPMFSFSFLGEQLNAWLLVTSSVESLGYGLSFSGMFYYMHIMATESGRNKTSILAISFALMNVGFLLPGMATGFVQAAIGYVGLFLVSSTVGLVVLFMIPFIPLPKGESGGAEALPSKS